MAHEYWDTMVMYYTCGLSLIMAFIATLALAESIKHTAFRWVQVIFFFSIVQDLTTFQTMYAVYLESDVVFRTAHPQFVAIFVGTAIFNFYFMNNLIYWLYGFKYWVMSIEVPGSYKQASSGNSGRFSKKCYDLISWVGILINLALCSVLAYQRYLLSCSFDNHTYTPAKLNL
jgi:hypothetical protein